METITQTTRVIYTAQTHTTGGREHGIAKSSDGRLDIKLSTPGTNGVGTNPEQLLAAGWSACFEGALGIAAKKRRLVLPEDTAIDAEIDLISGKNGYGLQARLQVTMPGLDRDIAEELINEAQQTCPYSKAIKGNVEVEYSLA